NVLLRKLMWQKIIIEILLLLLIVQILKSFRLYYLIAKNINTPKIPANINIFVIGKSVSSNNGKPNLFSFLSNFNRSKNPNCSSSFLFFDKVDKNLFSSPLNSAIR